MRTALCIAAFAVVFAREAPAASSRQNEEAAAAVSTTKGVWPEFAEARDVDAAIRRDDPAKREEALRHGGSQHVLYDTTVRIDSSGEMRAVWRDVLQIGAKSGLGRVGELTLEHVPGEERIEIVRLLRRRGSSGPWEELPYRVELAGAGKVDGLYVDAQTVAVIPEGIEVGDTVDFAYTIVAKKPVLDFEWQEADDADTRIASRRVVIDLPGGATPNFCAHGFPAPVFTEKDGRLRMEWLVDDVSPAAAEDWLPAGFDPRRRLLVSTVPSFVDLGARYLVELTRFGPQPKTAALARELSAQGGDPLWVFSAWVQEHIRYVGLEIKGHRIVPSPPDATLSRGYGDCKDMSALLAELLRRAGIDARTAFARRGDLVPVDPHTPMLSAFDHELVAVRRNGAWIFVDPTVTEAIPPWAGAAREGERMLIADGLSGLVEVGPQPDALDDVESMAVLRAAPCADGAKGCLSLNVETRYAGQALIDMRTLLLDAQGRELEREAADYYRRAVAGRALLGMRRDYSETDARRTPLVIRERFELGPKRRNDGCHLRYTPPEIVRWLDLPPVSGRLSPLGLGHPRKVRVRLTVSEAPRGISIPAPRAYRDRFVHMEKSARRLPNGDIEATWLAETLTDEVPLSDVREFASSLAELGDDVELVLCDGNEPAQNASEQSAKSSNALLVALAALVGLLGLVVGFALGRRRKSAS